SRAGRGPQGQLLERRSAAREAAIDMAGSNPPGHGPDSILHGRVLQDGPWRLALEPPRPLDTDPGLVHDGPGVMDAAHAARRSLQLDAIWGPHLRAPFPSPVHVEAHPARGLRLGLRLPDRPRLDRPSAHLLQ